MIAIIQCQWKRQNKFKDIIKALNKQTLMDFDLFIMNNDNNVNTSVMLEAYQNLAIGYEVKIITPKKNTLGFGRFILANNVISSAYNDKVYDRIITFDDDQIPEPEFVEYMNNNYKDRSYISTWGWKINGDDYFNRIRCIDFSDADYCGTNGMIIDSSIFTTDFIDKFDYRPESYWLEDLQLSMYCKTKGWNVQGIERKYLQLIEDKFDQSLKSNGANLKRIGYKILKKYYEL